MKLRFRLFVAALALFAAMTAPAAVAPATNISDLPYNELKQLFEKDDKLEGIRVTGFTSTEVTVVYHGRYINYDLRKLSPAQRAIIDKLVAAEAQRRRDAASKENEDASRMGLLREVDGVVYNLMRPASGWVAFKDVRLLQKTGDGVLVDIDKSGEAFQIIFVQNLPQFERVADRDLISFTAKYTGTHSFVNTLGVEKTVHKYDCGTIPGKSAGPRIAQKPGENSNPLMEAGWDSTATGFFITTDGYLVTCHHVVEGGKRFGVKNAAVTLEARLVAADPTNDVAILKVAGTFPALSINTNAVTLGQSVFTIGYPNVDFQGYAPKYTDGKVSSLSGLRDDSMNMQISVPVQPGNSGGPLTDANGAVVGIVVARLNDYAALRRTRTIPQNVNYAVKPLPLIELIRKAGIQNKVSFALPSAEKALENVQKSTVLVVVGD